MYSFVKFLLLLPLSIILVVLGVANRQPVTLQLDPFVTGAEGVSLTLPLFSVFYAALCCGALAGYAIGWLAQGKTRKACRALKRECADLARERDRIKAALPAATVAMLPRS